MNAKNLTYPVLCIRKGTIFTCSTSEDFTTTTASALRSGLFEQLSVIDSSGIESIVRSATKLCGAGLFWGFNVFLNQRIRVALELESTGKTLTADQVRQIILRDFDNWHGWQSREDFDELKDAVRKAPSIGEILRLVSS